ncbi:5-formyltetrahydrofolate cyclo-ligase [Ruficoccus amylovorans]|uniref:5-formyltetrahydrofolate cyclo-ligase n=1 Tax=Ruficoccus amylovorans TaxID=1804625 RepID=A0A842HEN3_9BACT|nr:5-formyltetrahydrofolate cyclo-ligase [Ruficoccus amylovorans]MBC2594037.1 5-formyltetrahydrofolate cyclo-ligase [Ruficoccus amylovorans]
MPSSMNSHSQKSFLRTEVRARRRGMLWQEVEAASGDICARVNGLAAWREARTVCAYLSLGNEVCTHALVGGAVSDKVILAPKSHDGGRMSWHRLRDWESLAPGMFGILEPPESEPAVEPPCPDLVLVPGLAFDRLGHRLGHGGGYYDRFLAGVSGVKVALAYSWQIRGDIPYERHDICMDAIVTEREVISVRTSRL